MSDLIMRKLPPGWNSVELGGLAADEPHSITDGPFGSNLKSEHYTESGPRVIRLQNIGEGFFVDERAHISREHYERLRKHAVFEGDLTIALLGERLPRACIVPSGVAPAIVKADCVRFRPNAKLLNAKYCNWWLNYSGLQRTTTAFLKGVGRPRINLSRLKSIFVPVPPRPEQDRIVAKIEELFSDLDAGVAALERVQAKLKRYRAAVLNAAVTGKLTAAWRQQNPPAEPAAELLARILEQRKKKWETVQLRKFAAAGKTPSKGWQAKYELPITPKEPAGKLPESWGWATIEQLTAGHRSSAYGVLQPGDDVPDGVPLVRVCDVIEGRVIEDQLKRIAPSISEQFQRTVLQGGEVLLTIVGTIGRTAVVPSSLCGANTARAVAVLPMTEIIPARFVEMMLRDTSMRARLTQAAHEVARKTLNLEDVRAASIPLPPTDEMQQIISEVDRRLSVVDAIETEVVQNLRRAARLRQAILKRAFEGKLVPQNPADPPVTLQQSTSSPNDATTAPSSRKSGRKSILLGNRS